MRATSTTPAHARKWKPLKTLPFSELPPVLLRIPWPALRGPFRNHFWKKGRPQPYWGEGILEMLWINLFGRWRSGGEGVFRSGVQGSKTTCYLRSPGSRIGGKEFWKCSGLIFLAGDGPVGRESSGRVSRGQRLHAIFGAQGTYIFLSGVPDRYVFFLPPWFCQRNPAFGREISARIGGSRLKSANLG